MGKSPEGTYLSEIEKPANQGAFVLGATLIAMAGIAGPNLIEWLNSVSNWVDPVGKYLLALGSHLIPPLPPDMQVVLPLAEMIKGFSVVRIGEDILTALKLTGVGLTGLSFTPFTEVTSRAADFFREL